jgi:methylated-DNA-[protein]-cysteine S-methyltransferase
MTILWCHHPSPLGELLLVGERGPDGSVLLRGLYLPEHRRGPAVQPEWRESEAAFTPARAELEAYFAGERTAFDLRLDVHGTGFQQQVWTELARIPFGETISYAELASRIGRPGAARAVGSAVARNPVSIVVPCHRVVGALGSLTGYAGGTERKAWLLEHERHVARRSAASSQSSSATSD